MSVTTGRSAHYRERTWLERVATAISPAVPGRFRGSLGRALRAALGRGRALESTLPGGERVRLTPDARHLGWNPEEYAAFRAATRSGDTVLDVGANVGGYTVLFAMWTAPAGQVFAFEPAPFAAAAMAELLRLNGCANRVEIVRSAAAECDGTVAFHADGASGLNGIVPDGQPPGHAMTVTTTSLDAFCEARGIRPRVVKIDTEGAELQVLRGARRTLARADVEVFVEFHPTAWPAFGVTREALAEEIARQGFRIVPLLAGDPWTTEGVAVALRRD